MVSKQLDELLRSIELPEEEYATGRQLVDQVAGIEQQIHKSRKILRIRDYLESLKKQKDVAIQAMREEELLEIIFRYDASEKTIVEAYELLRKIDHSKYKALDHEQI